MTNEKTEKLNRPKTRCFLKTDKSWTDYRSLTKTGLLANVDRLCLIASKKAIFLFKSRPFGGLHCPCAQPGIQKRLFLIVKMSEKNMEQYHSP